MTISLGNNNELNDIDLGDDLYETLPIQHSPFLHQDFRRASLRYHPHVLYKKASLRPIIGQNGKVTFTKRDRVRRSLSSLINSNWPIYIQLWFLNNEKKKHNVEIGTNIKIK